MDNAIKTWPFIHEKIIDYEKRDWYWMRNREGIVNFDEDKGGPWKSCYHNRRAMLESMIRFLKYNL